MSGSMRPGSRPRHLGFTSGRVKNSSGSAGRVSRSSRWGASALRLAFLERRVDGDARPLLNIGARRLEELRQVLVDAGRLYGFVHHPLRAAFLPAAARDLAVQAPADEDAELCVLEQGAHGEFLGCEDVVGNGRRGRVSWPLTASPKSGGPCRTDRRADCCAIAHARRLVPQSSAGAAGKSTGTRVVECR